jgi:hypothetical protein
MLALLISALPDFPSRDVSTDPKPLIAVFGIGFMVAVFGHIVKSKTLVAAGILMIFMATVGLPLYIGFTD